MAKTSYQSVDDYIESQPAPVQRVLREVRAAVRGALPTAVEGISYQMPAYKVDGRIVLYFAGWTRHYSLYPVFGTVVEALRDELAPYDVNDKGTARFPLDQPVPSALIARMAELRAREVQATARASGRKR